MRHPCYNTIRNNFFKVIFKTGQDFMNYLVKTIGVFVYLVLVGQYTHSMELEERGKRKLPEIEEFATEKLAKKQKILIPQADEFYKAIRFGNLEKIKTILNSLSPEIQKELVNYADTKGKWPLQQVVLEIPAEHPSRSKYFQITQELIEKGADINYFGFGKTGFSNQPLLLQAIDKENWNLAGFLFSKGTNPNITIPVDGKEITLMKEISNRIDRKIRYIRGRLDKLNRFAHMGMKYVGPEQFEEMENQADIKELERRGVDKITDILTLKARLQGWIK